MQKLFNEIDDITRVVDAVVEKTDEHIEPLRQTALKRFPTLFGFLITLGITMTILGVEQVVVRIPILIKHPTYLIGLGLFVLWITGRLHRKLG